MIQAMFNDPVSVALPVVPNKESPKDYDRQEQAVAAAPKGEVPPSTCSDKHIGISSAHCYPDQDVDDGNIDDGLCELLESGRKQGGL